MERLFVATFFTCSVVLLATCGVQSMSQEEPFSISASFSVDETGLVHRMTIQHTGQVELVEESTADEPGRYTIGVYAVDIGPKRAQEFRSVWAALSRSPLPKSEPVPPGITLVRVNLEERGKTETWMIDPSTSPPAMCRAAERIRDFAKEVRKKPVREVELKTGLDPNVVDRSASLRLAVRLNGRGTEAARVVDPFKAAQTGAGGFTLWGVRSDLPPADLWPQHSKQQVLTSRDATKSPQSGSNEFLAIPPNQTAVYEFNVPITWEPGEYAVKVIFETLTSSDGAINGKIISAPVKVRVR
jgi:hypothetical protein